MDPTADDLLARLRRNPDDMEALSALRALHRQEGDYEGLAKLLEGWAARCRDRRAASEGLREAADAVGSLLGDRERAVSLLTRALERDPRNAAAAEMVEQMLTKDGDVQRLVEVLERRATALGATQMDPRETGALHHRLGELWETEIGRVDRAVFHYRKAFELDPTLLEAIYAARRIYLSAGNMKAAATLYDLEANAETDVPRKVALLRELAQLRTHDLSDIEGAVVALKRAASAAPGDMAVKHELAAALMTRASVMGQATAAAEEDRQRAGQIFFELAQVVPEHAFAYCEATLDALPGHEQAMDLLEQLAQRDGRMDALPARWVGFLATNPEAPGADRRRERLAHAYVAAGQIDDAIACTEPLLERGNPRAAEMLIGLYRQAGRDSEVPRALAVWIDQLPDEQKAPRLHDLIEVLIAQSRHDEAVERARQVLDLNPSDDVALRLVDEHYRARGNLEELRQLLIRTAHAPGLSRDKCKARMLDVARISETELDDPRGALEAWREVVQLDRTDADAQAARLRLLEQEGRWDDVAWALESWLEVETDPETRADLLHKLAETHRQKRGDAYSAIDTLRSLRELRPEDDWARRTLCDLLLEVDRALDAIPVLRESVDKAPDVDERTRLLRLLATVLEERASDDEGASQAWERLLELVPDDRQALQRLEAIAVRNQQFDRLLGTLGRRVEVTAPEERPPLLQRMAKLADERLGDLDRAASLYEQVLELQPADDGTAEALAEVLSRSARWDDLVVLLKARADRCEDAAGRAGFHRRIAHVLRDRVGDEESAAESWREVLAAGEDEEALRALRRHADQRGDSEALTEWLGRLAEVSTETEEKRALLMERAHLMSEVLARPDEAADVLRRVVTELAPNDEEALVRLAEASEATGDDRGLADALERHLRIADGPAERASIASRLARLYDEALHEPERATGAYSAWAEADPSDETSRRRLTELLEQAERWEELLRVLDERAELEADEDLVGELLRRAADVAVHQLGDLDAGWKRLAPRVEAGDALAEDGLQELALATGRGEPLAELYVRIAKASKEPDEQRRRWMDAAKIFEEHVEDPQRALEAMLRAFAVDLDDPDMLEEVDRLAAAAGAWLRLAQVYESLVRKRENPEDKRRLLLRHADLLERDGGDPSAALDRVLRAAVLDPNDDGVLSRAENLARRAGRAEELLVLYERRRAQAGDPTDALESLLRAVRLCEAELGDRERAVQYLLHAVQISLEDAAMLDFLENEVRELDETAGGDALRRGLVSAYRSVAASRGQPAAVLLDRGARLVADQLEDTEGAYALLREATDIAPGSAEVLDAFEDIARERGLLADLDTQLAKLVDEAIDSQTAATVLERRGRLLQELDRHADAAEVYRQLLPIAPEGSDASERLRECLRAAGAFQDVLLVLDRELGRTREPARRAELLEEVAVTWERDLNNRWEALDAWKKVLAVDPENDEARQAVERLGRRTKLADDERLFESDPDPDEASATGDEGEEGLDAGEPPGDEAEARVLDAETEAETGTGTGEEPAAASEDDDEDEDEGELATAEEPAAASEDDDEDEDEGELA
ncbi:MAG: hypothetical protein ACOCXM_08445, partial [Myxococcota bacterium]